MYLLMVCRACLLTCRYFRICRNSQKDSCRSYIRINSVHWLGSRHRRRGIDTKRYVWFILHAEIFFLLYHFFFFNSLLFTFAFSFCVTIFFQRCSYFLLCIVLIFRGVVLSVCAVVCRPIGFAVQSRREESHWIEGRAKQHLSRDHGFLCQHVCLSMKQINFVWHLIMSVYYLLNRDYVRVYLFIYLLLF